MNDKLLNLEIAVDFDGTLTLGDYFPNIIGPNIEGINFLKKLQKHGVKIYLDTMRCGEVLDEAIEFCLDYGLVFDSIGPNENQFEWTESNKCYAKFSIDDRNVGIPLKYDENNKPYVDWKKLIPILIKRIKLEL